eukprot:Tamp_08220.p1 GENE.Tamp_08220~~Tamp_08220.p1  ORF type:complete len:464 (-),score=80.09 Tamp_08220:969-2267(-)
MAVVALVLGLAQVADVGGRRTAAAGGLGKRMQALSALSTGAQRSGLVAGKPARLRQLRIAWAGMLQEAGPDGNTTAATPAGEPADAAGQQTADGECCACPAAETAPAGGADAADPGPAAADANATDATGADATAAGTVGPATARASAGGLRLRKLLQENAAGAATNASAGGAEGANAEPAGDAPACCPCAAGAVPASQAREVPVFEDWSSSALPHTAWDSILGVLKVVGEGVYDDIDTGYHTVHDEDGERVVPKPEMPEHKAPWIGPHDIMVPSLEYVGEDHIRGWNVGPEIFGDGLPHDEDKEDKSYIFDKDVDQRITYMGDPMNVNGEQLPGVMVPWDRIPHPVEAARSGPPTPRPTHFVMHNDGTISMETVPADSSVPYRSGLRSVVFKPCKKHPLHGCELDPPMPQPRCALPPPSFTMGMYCVCLVSP